MDDKKDKVGKSMASSLGGPMAGKAYDALKNTNLGKNTLSNSGKMPGLSSSPLNSIRRNNGFNNHNNLNSKNNNKFQNLSRNSNFGMGTFTSIGAANEFSESSENEELDSYDGSIETTDSGGNGEILPKEVKKKILKFSIPPLLGCFGFIIVIVLIASIIILPLLAIGDTIKNGVNNVKEFFVSSFNFFTRGTFCSSDVSCEQKERDNFYNAVIDKYDYYYENYNIKLNTDLLIATLTYYDPMNVDYNTEEVPDTSNMVNFKKAKKQLNNLIDNLLIESKMCISSSGTIVNKLDSGGCPKKNTEFVDGIEVTYDVIEKISYAEDANKYKDYLLNSFVRKYFFDNRTDEETNKKVVQVVDEIFSRAEFASYLNGSANTSNSIVANNVNVNIYSADNVLLEQVSLFEYLQGVLYYEGFATNRSLEFLKMQAIIAKNYLYSINNASIDSIPTSLRVINSRQNQVYCNIKEGCHNMYDASDEEHNTIATGAGSGGYQPITNEELLEKINTAIDSTFSEFIVNNNKFVFTQYRSDCSVKGLTCNATTNILDQKVANTMIESGSSYKDVLTYYYNGSIETVSLSIGYPLDLKYTTVTSQFSWRIDPVTLSRCTSHNGLDISADGDANIYSIADGVIVKNEYNEVYGNHIVIGHGAYNNDTNTYEFYSLYAHQIRLSKLVSVGDKVKAGQKIGNVGSTGYSTGNHLHIEIYKIIDNSIQREDPETYFSNIELKGLTGSKRYPSKQACLSALGK